MKKIVKLTESELRQIIEKEMGEYIMYNYKGDDWKIKYGNFTIKFDLYGPDSLSQLEGYIQEILENKFGNNIQNIKMDVGYIED